MHPGAQRYLILKDAVRNGTIQRLQSHLRDDFDPRLVSDPVFLRQTMLELKKQLGPIEILSLGLGVIPIDYIELADALRDVNLPLIEKYGSKLKLSSTDIELLACDEQFRAQAIQSLESKIDFWATKYPDKASKILPQVPAMIRDHIFDRNEFIQDMIIGLPSLKTLTLITMPGGARFLERALGLPVTGEVISFMLNYSDTYYCRRIPGFRDNFYSCFKAAKNHDLEILDICIQKNPESAPYDILTGAIHGGHLDLVKTYAPKCPLTRVAGSLSLAVAKNEIEIYWYLHDMCVHILTSDNYPALLESATHLEIYKIISRQIIDPEQRFRAQRRSLSHVGQDILDYLELGLEFTYQLNDYVNIIQNGVKNSNVEMIKRYLIPRCQQIQQSQNRDFVDRIFATSPHIKITKLLHSLGLRIPYIKMVDALRDGSDLEMMEFYLDQFDPQGVDNFYLARLFVKVAWNGFMPREATELVLDHPGFQSWEPCKILLDLIFNDGGQYDSNRIQLPDWIKHYALEMVIHRGVKIDYVKGFCWIAYDKKTSYLMDSLVSYMSRLDLRLTLEEYQQCVQAADVNRGDGMGDFKFTKLYNALNSVREF